MLSMQEEAALLLSHTQHLLDGIKLAAAKLWPEGVCPCSKFCSDFGVGATSVLVRGCCSYKQMVITKCDLDFFFSLFSPKQNSESPKAHKSFSQSGCLLIWPGHTVLYLWSAFYCYHQNFNLEKENLNFDNRIFNLEKRNRNFDKILRNLYKIPRILSKFSEICTNFREFCQNSDFVFWYWWLMFGRESERCPDQMDEAWPNHYSVAASI